MSKEIDEFLKYIKEKDAELGQKPEQGETKMNDDDKSIARFFTAIVLVSLALVMLGLWGCPQYNVWEQQKAGEAELARAESNRRIKTLEAAATFESSKQLAQAEIERAKGVAEANRIIGQSLHDNEAYLRYLWIHNLETGGNSVIYVPTEAGLPILEAGKRPVQTK